MAKAVLEGRYKVRVEKIPGQTEEDKAFSLKTIQGHQIKSIKLIARKNQF